MTVTQNIFGRKTEHPVADLVHFKAEDKYITGYTKNGRTLLLSGSLDKLVAEHPNQLIKASRFEVFNVAYVTSMCHNKFGGVVFLGDTAGVHVSRRQTRHVVASLQAMGLCPTKIKV